MVSIKRHWAILLCTSWLAFATNAAAACLDAPDLAHYRTDPALPFAAGPTQRDRNGRVVAPVSVNGQGPFRFIVDTGANRSVLSQGLADRLGLSAIGMGNVHSVYGVTSAPMVRVTSLQYGDVSLRASDLPLLQGPVLAGEHGLLGVDGMAGRRLRMDFERNCIEIVPSRDARRLHGWVSIRGELRFGHLVVVHGMIDRVRVNMLLDTGSDSSLANPALRVALDARMRRRPRVENTIAYSAGRPVVLENAILVPRMSMGELQVNNVTAYVGDFHIFRLWGLSEEPTLLLGMDVLSQARGIAIDYARASVHLHLRQEQRGSSRLQRYD